MSGRKAAAPHSMQGVFVFVLLGIFALMSTLLVLLSAQMYRATVDRAEASNGSRVLSAYVRGMVRAEDAYDAVTLEEHDGIQTVALYEDIGQTRFVTWIYAYEGRVYELWTEAEYGFDPTSGTAVCEVGGFEPSLENGLLSINMTDAEGEDASVRVALRCAR